MSPADAWQRSGMPSDRPSATGRSAGFDRRQDDYGPRSPRSAPPPPRGRYAEPERYAESAPHAERGRPMERTRAAERGYYGEPDMPRRGARRPDSARSGARPARGPAGRPADPRGASGRPHRGSTAAALEDRGSRLRGAVAVGAVFVLTLAVAAVESFLGTGLGIVTLVALVLTTVLAALLVRRRDLLSVIVSPPLVFVAVAVADVAAAPSASLNLATLATLLIRGFPAMAIATVAALVIGLVRKARGRR